MEKINNKFFAFFEYLRADKKRAFISGLIIYTAIFVVCVLKFLVPAFNETGTLLGGDGVASYYPVLLQFRRNVIIFFENLMQGKPEFNMINFDYLFGTDCFISNYTAMLPLYALSALFPESAIPAFMGWALIIMTYIAGLSFIYMCRYFKRDMLWSCFFAAMYAFCGNYFYTGVFNPYFLSMNIAFPLMIVGMDRILTEKGWALLPVSVAWLSIIGFPYLVYTLPFVVVYALIRVYFLYKKTFFRSLGKYFLRGSLSVLLGMVMCGIVLLPNFINFFNSARTSGEATLSIAELLIPNFNYAIEAFKGEGLDMPTGVFTAGITCFLYFFIASRSKKEIKCMSFVMLILIMSPLVRYGLNGFKYDICRWGFIPALFIVFCCVEYMPRLLKLGRVERGIYIFTLVAYGILFTISLREAAIVFVFVMSLFSNIRILRKLMFKGARVVKRLFLSLKEKEKSFRRFISLLIIVLVAVGLIMTAVYIVFTGRINRLDLLLTALIGTIVIVLVASRKKLKAIGSVLLAGICVFTQLVYSRPVGFDRIKEDTIYTHAGKVKHDDNMFGRIMPTTSEFQVVTEVEDEDETLSLVSDDEEEQSVNDTDTLEGEHVYIDFQLNSALIYGVPTAEAFRGTLNGDYMKFLKRCGQDSYSIYSVVVVTGFSLKEVLYSVFGVDGLLSEVESDIFYGFEKEDEVALNEDQFVYIYKNKYALPMGVTFDEYMSKERFEGLNGAELPYAMMNSVYFEGYEPAETVYEEYSRVCDYDFIQEKRGETTFGITCYDNKIKLNEDLTGNFLYLQFEGYHSHCYESAMFEPLEVKIDDKEQYNFSVHNNNTNWNWKYTPDMYVFPLGFCEERIDEINFVSPFEFEKMTLHAVPEEVYLNGYDKCTADILENAELTTNTLTGTVDLEKDKAMVISLLYSKDYKAYIDDVEVPVYRANDIFLGINVPAGSHTIRIDYVSAWAVEGFILSASGTIILIVLYFVFKKRKKSKEAAMAENQEKIS